LLRPRAYDERVRRGLAFALVAIACAAVAPATRARDPGRWVDTGFSRFQLTYNQGITIDPASRNVFFDGTALSFNGLFRTNESLQQSAAASPDIPPAVTATDGYNHMGDLSWDPAEGGRLLLPLECYTLGAPAGGNTCGTGAFAVADPLTLQWRYYVKLDPADIQKAMWVESSPDGRLLWTSSGRDLIAYRAADLNPANAAPAGPPLRPVVRLAGAVPPSGISGATFYNGRLFLLGGDNGRFQVWSVDTTSGHDRLEIERNYVGETEGLAQFSALGGVLQAEILPSLGVRPTFGSGHGALVHFAPARRVHLRLTALPRDVRAGTLVRVRFRVSFAAFGGTGGVKGATVLFAGRRAVTDSHGRASLRVVLATLGRYRASAAKSGFKRARASVIAQ
jgi:hypothetical protein